MDESHREIQLLRAQLAEEQHRREEEQHGREEEQRRREEAERIAASARPQNLANFLKGCHRISTQMVPVTDPTASTGGATTNPTNRLVPKRIAPWKNFVYLQQEFWTQYTDSPLIWTKSVYASVNYLTWVEQLMKPIGSEDDLRFIERLTLESMVRMFLQEVEASRNVHDTSTPLGHITFENPTNFKEEEVSNLKNTMQGLSLDDQCPQPPRNTRADRFCVTRSVDGTARPIVAIEYKAPHKLTVEEICIGLESEILPARDVIDQHHDDVGFLCKNLMAAVITQLFSYMIDKGVRYGYVCTGLAFVFVHILEHDPTTVEYCIRVPNRDYTVDGENRLECTAVAQVAAFIFMASQDEQPTQSWLHLARNNLTRWKVEFIDVLKTIPETLRKSRDTSVYRPSQRVRTTRTSPYKLRKRCKPHETAQRTDDEDSDSSDGDGDTPSPTQRIQTRSMVAARRGTHTDKGDSQSRRGQHTGPSNSSRATTETWHYCTQRCLLGLTTGLAVDRSCPNAGLHGQSHLSHMKFIRLLRKGLTFNGDSGADCRALYIHGARGALLQVRLTTHGYTLVGKGMVSADYEHLKNEADIYDQLYSIQGLYVPVSCGLLDLPVPFYYDGAEVRHLLLMSSAGQSLQARMRQGTDSHFFEHCIGLAIEALKAIHDRQILHRDAFSRNIMYDETTGKVFIIDFERSERRKSLVGRRILGEVSSNRRRKRTNRDAKSRGASPDPFDKESRHMESNLRRELRCT